MQPTKAQLSQQKRDMVQRAYSAIMHILTDSQLYGTSLWPKHGFKPGYAIDKPQNDTIWISVSYSVNEKNKISGGLGFNKMEHFNSPRGEKQCSQLRLIIDASYYDGFLFKDTFRDQPNFFGHCWFTYTHNETTTTTQ